MCPDPDCALVPLDVMTEVATSAAPPDSGELTIQGVG